MKVFHSSRRQKLWETGGNESGVAIVVCDALASTHHLRYVREERATPRLRLFPPVRETSRAECRASGCALFPKRILRCRLVSTTGLSYKAFAETRPYP